MMKWKADTTLLHTVQDKIFPTYAVQVIDPRTVCVGGGGSVAGGAFCGLMFVEVLHDGQCFKSRPLGRVSTEDVPVDAMSVHVSKDRKLIACGRSDKCVLYSANLDIASSAKGKISEDNLDEKQNQTNGVISKKNLQELSRRIFDSLPMEYSAQEIGAVRVDKSDRGELTCLRMSSDASLVVTGSLDGFIRVFTAPGMESVREVHAHTKEVYDLDISSDCQKIVSVGADSCGYVWQLKDGKKLSQLELPTSDKYRFRRCKFSHHLSESRPSLYTIANPPMKSKYPSLLQRWNTGNFLCEEVARFRDALSSVSVSTDSRYVAVGTMTGHVMIHDGKTLQRLHWFRNVHGAAVTAMEFLPAAMPFVSATGDIETAVVSVALDGFTKIHSLTLVDNTNYGIGILVILIAMLITYLLSEMSVLGVGFAEEPEL